MGGQRLARPRLGWVGPRCPRIPGFQTSVGTVGGILRNTPGSLGQTLSSSAPFHPPFEDESYFLVI